MDFEYFKQTTIECLRTAKKFLQGVIKHIRRNGQCYFLIGLFFGFIIFCEVTFPQELQFIVPQLYESHPDKNLNRQIRNMGRMKPRVFNESLVNTCQDIEVNQNQIVFCINQKNKLVEIDTQNNQVIQLKRIEQGLNYGLKLSKDQKVLYFTNSQLGLCSYNFETKTIQSLVKQYRSEFLRSLKSIQIHPENPDILYLTQSTTQMDLSNYHIDVILNNPFGRVFQFNKQSYRISLVADGLYFPNGLVYQKYNGQQTLLVSETSRNRITRVYIDQINRGIKKIYIDKLDIYPGNIKSNQKGELWVASLGQRDSTSVYYDKTGWIRRFMSRLPQGMFNMYADRQQFGGILVKPSNKDLVSKPKIKYVYWNSYFNYQIVSTLFQINGKLFISNPQDPGILVIDQIAEKLKKKQQTFQRIQVKLQQIAAYKFGGEFMEVPSSEN